MRLDPSPPLHHHRAVRRAFHPGLRLGLAACACLVGLGVALGVAPRAVAWVPFTTDGGIPLAWPAGTILDIAIQDPVPAGFDREAIRAAVTEAFDAWLGHGECTPPTRAAVRFASDAAMNADDGVVAIVWFTDQDAWRARYAAKDLAHTEVKFGPTSGAIVDGDIAVNVGGFLFAVPTDATCTALRYDLRAALTHEAGHVLGLDHSFEAGATMNKSVVVADCDKRDLAADDVAGLCALYVRPDAPEGDPASGEAGPEVPVDAAPEAADAAPESHRLPPDCATGGAPDLGVILGLVVARYLKGRTPRLRRARRASARDR